MNSSTQNFDDDSPPSADDHEGDYDESLRAGVYPLGLSKAYVPSWTRQDAFRELYQNWKDAIIGCSHLDPRSFTPFVQDTTSHIEITIRSGQTSGSRVMAQKLLGYIRFDKKAGTLELTNFEAALDMKHLSLGVSEKRNQGKFAGTHGEGFKLAALVLCRAGLAVRFTSSSFYWNFGFRGKNRSTLCCRLSQVKDTKLQALKKQYNSQVSRLIFERGLTSNVWEDVTVKISKPRGEHDIAISEKDFRRWMQVTIELDPPASDKTIRTEYGDLILDPRFKGLIYLKGLQIAGHEKSYMRAYNFIQGKINRDRDRLANLDEEKKTVSRIWGDAILAKGAEIADVFIELLQNHKDCAETLWTSEKMTAPPVKKVWQRLRQSKPEAFFYVEEDADGSSGPFMTDKADIIRKDLKSAPVLVSKALWKLFRKFNLARTPEEEQSHRFGTSPVVSSTHISSHINIIQALKASLFLNPILTSLNVGFVEGGGTDLDLVFDADTKLVKIHQKWLDFNKVHEQTTCDVSQLPPGQVDQQRIFCDHVVEDLFELVLEEIGTTFKISLPEYRAHRGRVRTYLRMMPRMVEVSQCQTAGAIKVSWVGSDNGLLSSKHDDHVKYIVILHRESTCKSRRNDLIFRSSATIQPIPSRSGAETSDSMAHMQCGCLSLFVPLTNSKARFEELDYREKYFPMVARADKVSFFGPPPASIAPRSSSSFEISTRSSRKDPLTSSPNTQASPLMIGSRARTRRSVKTTFQDRSTDTDDLPPPPQANIATSTEGMLSGRYDEIEWRNWIQNDLLREFAKMRTRHEKHEVTAAQSIGSLECPHLEFHFETGEYACIQFSSSDSPEYPVLIHEIFSAEEDFDRDTTYLLVTRYSVLESFFTAHAQSISNSTDMPETAMELILNFQEFDKMGLRDDAEIIKLSEIISARQLTSKSGVAITEIDHFVHRPQSLANTSAFCVFAIGKSRNVTEACLTPIASHLLPRRDRWKEVKFPTSSEPVVYDFSPQVLGPSEGFSQAGFAIEMALGFDPLQHVSWKARHHTSQVYDGSVKSILQSFDNDQLRSPVSSQLAAPKVAVVAGSSVPFRLNDQNKDLPSLDQFLKVLDDFEDAAKSSLKPTFTVMLVSPAIFRSQAVHQLNATMLRLLEQRLSVHMKICSLGDQGLPLQRDILVLIASSLSSSVPWNLYWPTLAQPRTATIEHLIRDLSFENARTTDGSSSGFICLHPDAESPGSQDTTYIHNHHTGQQTSQSLISLQWDTDKLDALTITPKPWVHPTRKDRLTVREIARLQGFPDDYVFYLSEEAQYKDVWVAFPPVITKSVGQTIRFMLQRSQTIKMGDRMQGSRGQKRARVDGEV